MISDIVSKLPYRPCVGVVLLNGAGQVFVARRIDTPDGWQMPQGGIDDGEAPVDAALRELAEETGVRSVHVVAESADWLQYDLPDDLIGNAWGGKYRGQRQKWFVLRFRGDEGEIDLQGHKDVEFDAWKWVDMGELPTMTVFFKRQLYADIIREFGHLAVPESKK